MPEKLLTYEEVAEILSVKPSHVEGLIKRGELPGFKVTQRVTRVRLSDLEKFMSEDRTTREKNPNGSGGSATEGDFSSAIKFITPS